MKLAVATIATVAAIALCKPSSTDPPGESSCTIARAEAQHDLRWSHPFTWTIPSCEEDGSWSAEQRRRLSPSSAVTWCVRTQTGERIASTTRRAGEKRTVPCGADELQLAPAVALSHCEQKATEVVAWLAELKRDGWIVGAVYIPQCMSDGSYRRRQCAAGMVTSACWCAHPTDGTKEPCDDDDAQPAVSIRSFIVWHKPWAMLSDPIAKEE